MQTDLWTLNEGFQPLARLAQQSLGKEQFKLTFKLGRIFKAAKSRMDDWGDDVSRLMATHGIKQSSDSKLWQIEDNEKLATPDQIEGFNKATKALMKEEMVSLVGDHFTPFDASEILQAATISALDFGLLYGWLITGELPEDMPEEKAAGVAA